MDWTQVYTIIGVNIALAGIFVTIVVWSQNRMDSDIKGACARLDGHATRIDQLYKMFVDLLKAGK